MGHREFSAPLDGEAPRLLRTRSQDSLFDVGGTTFFPGIEETIADAEFQNEIDLVFLLPAYQEIMGKRLGEVDGSASEVDRIEAANSISRMVPNGPTLEALERLLQDPSSEVVLYALASEAVHRRPEHVPLILRLLANPMTRDKARSTLAAYGPGVEELIAPALRDEAAPLEVRRAIPEVLARVGTQNAADILLDALALRRDDLEAALVEALYKVGADHPGVPFRERTVRPELLFLARKACEAVLNPSGAGDETGAALDIQVRRVFDLMTLLYPGEDR